MDKLSWEVKGVDNNIIYASVQNNSTCQKNVPKGKTTQNAFPESIFEFELTRYKDKVSMLEYLKIDCYCYDNGARLFNGSVQTSIDDLDTPFKQFMKYGVIFSNENELVKLKMKIKSMYLSLKKTPYNNQNDSRFDDLLHEVGKYAELMNKNNPGDECFIPIKDFDEMAYDCGYKNYEITELKKELRNLGYIRTAKNRIAILARYQSKVIRGLSFICQKLIDNKYIEDKEQNEVKEQDVSK